MNGFVQSSQVAFTDGARLRVDALGDDSSTPIACTEHVEALIAPHGRQHVAGNDLSEIQLLSHVRNENQGTGCRQVASSPALSVVSLMFPFKAHFKFCAPIVAHMRLSCSGKSSLLLLER